MLLKTICCGTLLFMFDFRQTFFSLYQMTPLHLAAERGSIEIVRYLVEQGASINIQDNNGVSVTILD